MYEIRSWCKKHASHMPVKCQQHAGNMLTTYWQHAGNMLTTFWQHAGNMLATCWQHGGNMLVTCWRHAGNMLATCWQHAGDMLVTRWRHAGNMLATIRLFFRVQRLLLWKLEVLSKTVLCHHPLSSSSSVSPYSVLLGARLGAIRAQKLLKQGLTLSI